jgi:arabinogalactan endo-1,4-beta-galactosidase
VNVLATPSQMRTHHDIPSPAPSAALTMQVSASAGSGTTISVYESIELVATTPNGHAYVDGIFSWEPLAVQLREG